MRISGCGCSLIDLIYNNVSFESEPFLPYRSKGAGDGGIDPGRLVFLEDFENFSKTKYQTFVDQILEGREPDGINVGGPSIVALVLAAQLLAEDGSDVSYFGNLGNDQAGQTIKSILEQTPVSLNEYQTVDGMTPRTLVLSDPNYHDGHGERAFINALGVSAEITPSDLTDHFYNSDIVLFGATALTPLLHQNLSQLVEKAHQTKAFVIVTTVFDFLNEQKNPDKPWPLINEEQQKLVDLLIMDFDEALRISGTTSLPAAIDFFQENFPAFIITHGPDPVVCFSKGSKFSDTDVYKMPISQVVLDDRSGCAHGDTTGCGDNFCGGVIASIARQLQKQIPLNMKEAVATGICSGGFARYQLGGITIEKEPGEIQTKIESIYQAYRKQVESQFELPEKIW